MKALNSNDRDFDIKAAGTAMRFLTAFLSKVVGEWTITGTERMKNRPIKILVDALNALGATPMDLMSILQSMQSAGCLRAKLEII